MYVFIKPKTETIIKEYVTSSETYNIDSISISITEIQLNAYAVIETVFFSQGKYIKKTQDLLNSSNGYNDWKDDQFIIDFIFKKYNLEKPTIL